MIIIIVIIIIIIIISMVVIIIVTINVQGCGLVPFPPNLCHLPIHDRHCQPSHPAECAQDRML